MCISLFNSYRDFLNVQTTDSMTRFGQIWYDNVWVVHVSRKLNTCLANGPYSVLIIYANYLVEKAYSIALLRDYNAIPLVLLLLVKFSCIETGVFWGPILLYYIVSTIWHENVKWRIKNISHPQIRMILQL